MKLSTTFAVAIIIVIGIVWIGWPTPRQRQDHREAVEEYCLVEQGPWQEGDRQETCKELLRDPTL